MDNVQIEIQDSANGIEGVLDVGNVKNFGMALTTSIADLRDIKSRSGSFAVTFKVPSTKNNDDLLQHIYLSEQKNYKDFDAEKDCVVRINGMDIERGRLQITKINSLGRADATSYSFKFFGNNMDWVLKMKGYKTKDLPYLDKTLTYGDTEVQASWLEVGGDEEPVYSIINRGSRVSPTQVSVEDLRADYFALDYLNSAFNLVGYNFESDFFNTADQKQLIIPFFGKNWKILQSEIDDNFVEVRMNGNNTNVNLNVPTIANGAVWKISSPIINLCTAVGLSGNPYYTCIGQSITGAYTEISDTNNNFLAGVFTAPIDGFYKVKGIFETSYFYDTSIPEATSGNLSFSVTHFAQVNGTTPYILNTNASNTIATPNTTIKEIREVWGRESNGFYMNAGDTMRVHSQFQAINNGPIFSSSITATYQHWGSTQYEIELQPDMIEGDTYNWGEKSDDQVEVFDIVMDIFRTFNCYIRTNQATRTVYAEPRDDFYKPLSEAINKTNLIDDNNQITLEYNSKTYKETHNYEYARDSNDKFLAERNKRANNEWMSNEHTFPAKFKDGTTNYKTKVISATYLDEDTAMSGVSAGSGGNVLGLYTAKMWNEDDTVPVHSDDFNPRLLYFKYGQQADAILTFQHVINYKGSALTSFGYALPFPFYQYNGAYAPVAGNLSFKDVFIPANPSAPDAGVWQTYFSRTSQEIEEGKRLSLSMVFDLEDWISFDFRDSVYFDNRYPEIEGYWRIEKIKSYKPTSTAISVKVDLIQARTYFAAESETTEEPSDPFGGARLTGGGLDRSVTNETSKKTLIEGYDNYATDNGNMVVGHDLRASGQNQLIYGMYNSDSSSDISTDLLQFGVGTENNPRTLIRVDEDGVVWFNGSALPIEGGSGTVVDITSDVTADVLVKTYLADTTSNSITVTLPSSVNEGQSWNIKKTSNNNTLTVNTAGSELIDGEDEISETELNISRRFQYDGDNYKII